VPLSRFAPLVGAMLGILGGCIYWLAVQIWPSSVALILSMAATALTTAQFRGAAVFYLLLKYNVLMALSSAKLPFAAPANLPLGLIMVAGLAASYALVVAVMATRPQDSAARVSNGALAAALLIGFAPATLLGIPGLAGLAVAVIAGLSFIGYLKYKRMAGSSDTFKLAQMGSEISFYLAALATWRFV
jgi:adenosylcobinamide-GDP ribazoletransferase